MNEQSLKIADSLQIELNKFITESKESLTIVKNVAAAHAWKILQLAIAISIQFLENIATDLSGPDKKKIAMQALSEFYDKVFIVVNIPFLPSLIEPVLHKYVKAFFMVLVGASIDAMVTTFKQIGVFKDKNINTLSAAMKKQTLKTSKKRK
jgi:hypothetical protein